MARNSYSRILKIDNTYAKLIPYIQDSIKFQDFKNDMAKVQLPKQLPNYDFEKNKNIEENTKLKKHSHISKNIKKKSNILSDLSKYEFRRLEKILKHQSYSVDKKSLILNGKRYITGKRVIRFILRKSEPGNKRRKHFKRLLRVIRNFPSKNKSYIAFDL